eukprot:scaffold96784_cov66-Phaeocystis_antarctica.AAC.3
MPQCAGAKLILLKIQTHAQQPYCAVRELLGIDVECKRERATAASAGASAGDSAGDSADSAGGLGGVAATPAALARAAAGSGEAHADRAPTHLPQPLAVRDLPQGARAACYSTSTVVARHSRLRLAGRAIWCRREGA